MLKFTIVKPILNYLSEVRVELLKVVWPGREEVIKLTTIVLLISAIVAAYVGVLDFLLTRLLTAFFLR